MATYDSASKKRQISESKVLRGWKEIANYLRKGIRTVQRYERELDMPIRRTAGKAMGLVIVSKSELDDWIKATPTRARLRPRVQATFNQTNRLGADFLLIDSEIALTFSNIALESSDLERKRRAAQTARAAYNAITRLRKNIVLGETEKEKLESNLHRLRSELRILSGNSPSVIEVEGSGQWGSHAA